jgi:hypothetical protein
MKEGDPESAAKDSKKSTKAPVIAAARLVG